ncbi:DNA-3-methyladenine glycosylase [Streptomyces sp. XM4193]|uniref:DNA-3-methyladenine glycosylase n=1 Tax=Streptomyces sp. XM4193 TaxID=2929782 RepID=UPI001FF8B4B0|nr:DNA-3-methyladenine glycosylase [Streptomyces sp. XM4193]MCK1796566.1 DNA-3-methyladenine glycosylase [Streptomyces sp. XM4193]
MFVGRDRTALPRSFFDRPVLDVAPELLGKHLLRTTEQGPMVLRITEVEAYNGSRDPGSHAYRGRTERNASMFGPPGHAYVYFTYGMWHCLNLVCGEEGVASGLLLRGGEVLEGTEQARSNRPKARNDHELAKGPARLATALSVDRRLNGTDVCPSSTPAPLLAQDGDPVPARRIRRGPRTGVGGEGAARPWRFWIDGDPTVSPYRPHQPRKRRTR